MTRKEIIVTNTLGIHARPAFQIATVANKFSADTTLVKDSHSANARSIMSLMMLAAGQNAKITIQADGKDEQAAVDALVELFEKKFNEE
jgi:phosphocarrier protein